MFAWITIISLCGAVVLICVHSLLFSCGHGPRLSFKGAIRRIVHLFVLLFLEQRPGLPGRIRKLFFLLAIFSGLVLAATGFGPVIAGVRIAGWLLMIHATFGGVFVLCIAFLTLTYAQEFVFVKGRRRLPCICEDFMFKVCFWAMVLLILPAALSMVLSMFPLFGTQGQEDMLWIHRCSTLGFAIAALFEIYLAVRGEFLADGDLSE